MSSAIQQRAAGLRVARPSADLPVRDLVLCHLEYGQARAITQGALAKQLHLEPREVMAAVETLRREGVAICTGSAGVWLTADAGEVRDQYRRLRRRALHQLANLRRMLRTADAMERPLTLWPTTEKEVST